MSYGFWGTLHSFAFVFFLNIFDTDFTGYTDFFVFGRRNQDFDLSGTSIRLANKRT